MGPQVAVIQDHVAIDPRTGAALDEFKYDREVLTPGTEMQLRLTVELPAGSANRFKAVTGHLLAALEAGDILFGAALTSGLGRMKLEWADGDGVLEQSLTGSLGILELLDDARRPAELGTGTTPEALKAADPALVPAEPGVMDVQVRWKPGGPIMSGVAVDGIAVDTLPAVLNHSGDMRLLLPGSSIKGALRSRAAFIVRSILNPADGTDEKSFPDDLPIVGWLFGAPALEKSDKSMDKAGPLPGRGALRVASCLSATPLSHELWTQILASKKGDEIGALLEKGTGALRWAAHVALDRWTSAPAPGKLFFVLEPRKVDWEPIDLRIDLGRIPAGERVRAMVLLRLVLEDFRRNLLPLGRGATRGCGWVVGESVQWTVSGVGDGWEELTAVLVGDSIPEAARSAWNKWARENGGGDDESDPAPVVDGRRSGESPSQAVRRNLRRSHRAGTVS
jgi:CRISPR/Cas system CSM-associated protein Csm3 (group 7 of RAMP superfamily)